MLAILLILLHGYYPFGNQLYSFWKQLLLKIHGMYIVSIETRYKLIEYIALSIRVIELYKLYCLRLLYCTKFTIYQKRLPREYDKIENRIIQCPRAELLANDCNLSPYLIFFSVTNTFTLL